MTLPRKLVAVTSSAALCLGAGLVTALPAQAVPSSTVRSLSPRLDSGQTLFFEAGAARPRKAFFAMKTTSGNGFRGFTYVPRTKTLTCYIGSVVADIVPIFNEFAPGRGPSGSTNGYISGSGSSLRIKMSGSQPWMTLKSRVKINKVSKKRKHFAWRAQFAYCRSLTG